MSAVPKAAGVGMPILLDVETRLNRGDLTVPAEVARGLMVGLSTALDRFRDSSMGRLAQISALRAERDAARARAGEAVAKLTEARVVAADLRDAAANAADLLDRIGCSKDAHLVQWLRAGVAKAVALKSA